MIEREQPKVCMPRTEWAQAPSQKARAPGSCKKVRADRGTVSVHEHKDAVLDSLENQGTRPLQRCCYCRESQEAEYCLFCVYGGNPYLVNCPMLKILLLLYFSFHSNKSGPTSPKTAYLAWTVITGESYT